MLCSLFVTCKRSKKSGDLFWALVCDLGYRQVYLSFDPMVISEIMNWTPRSLENIKEGEKVELVTWEVSHE